MRRTQRKTHFMDILNLQICLSSFSQQNGASKASLHRLPTSSDVPLLRRKAADWRCHREESVEAKCSEVAARLLGSADGRIDDLHVQVWEVSRCASKGGMKQPVGS